MNNQIADGELAVEIKGLSHCFGQQRVLNDINLKITAGQIVALVGPSGCGKSTLLKAILGTHPPSEGEVIVDGKVIDAPCRNVGIVYQHYGLFDFLTAESNVAFGLKLDSTSLAFRTLMFPKWLQLRKQHLEQSHDYLKRVGLEASAGKYPTQLSGGMRQRVAIAQSLILKPKLLLLDEPFGALDEATRESLQMMLLRFYQENLKAKAAGRTPEYTILIVTHELNEALYVANRVIGLSRFHDQADRGAMLVYDRPCPVFQPNEPKDLEKLVKQREELRRAVFDPAYVKHYSKYVSFWSEVAAQEAAVAGIR